MRLKKITLNNFRCFESLEIDIHPRLTVLVGENGAGKTAILDGIATALTPVMTYLSSANQRLTGRGISDADFRLEAAEKRAGKTRWKPADYAQIIAKTTDDMEWDYWRPSGSGNAEPKIKLGLTQLKNHLVPIYQSYNTGKPALTPIFAYYGIRRGDIEVPERLRESKENYDFPTSALIGALDSKNDFKEFLKWFDGEEASELRANKGVANDDYAPSTALDALRATVIALLGGTYENPYFNKEHKFVVEPQGGGAPLLITQLSQGYQSMLALGMDFARRMALANSHMDYGNLDSVAEALADLTELGWPDGDNENLPTSASLIAPAIMLVDEIDLHLHPGWQQRVLGDLMRAFPNTQFIVTTHSPQVLTTVNRDHIRILQSVEAGFEAKRPDFSPLAHESGDALTKIMGTHREPELPLQETIRSYEQLVRAGQEEAPGAQQLRAILDEAGYQIHESDLMTWRFLAARKTGKAD